MYVQASKTPLWHKVLCVLMAVVLALGLSPIIPNAIQKAYADPAYPGNAYVSLSKDGKFVVSDGEEGGVTLAHVAIPLQDIADINLASYGLGDFVYEGSGEQDSACPTVLKLYVYLHLHYYSEGINGLTIKGSAHSMYMQDFWGHGENLLYYVNGAYPQDTSLGANMGATADQIKLVDNDFVDLAMYDDWSFYDDDKAGFNYFVTPDSDLEEGNVTITHEYTATAGEPFTVKVARGMGDIMMGEDTSFGAAADLTLHHGTEIDVDDESTQKLSDGTAQVTFEQPGTYYVWVDGGKGSSGTIVSCPASAKVTVEGDAPVNPNTIEVNANGVATIAISGAQVVSCTTDGTTYNVVLAEDTADGTQVTATFTALGDARFSSTNSRIPQSQQGMQIWQNAFKTVWPLETTLADGAATGTIYNAAAFGAAVQGSYTTHTVNFTVAQPPAATTVYTTLIRYGNLETGKDGTKLVNVPLAFDAGATLTVDDVAAKLHELYFENGLDGFNQTVAASDGSGSALSFWGEGLRYGYQSLVDGVKSTKDTAVAADSSVLLFTWTSITASHTSSDYITKFDKTRAEIAGGEALTLNLQVGRPTWNEEFAAVSGGQIAIDGVVAANKATDAEGNVTLYFANAGTYLVTFVDEDPSDARKYIQAYCTVTVTADDASAAADIAADKEALSVPAGTSENLTLPITGASGKTSISWATSNADAISTTGAVRRIDEDQNVTLTATLTYGTFTETRTFDVIVYGNASSTELEKAAQTLAAAQTLEPQQWNATGNQATERKDTNVITMARAIVGDAYPGVTIADAVVSSDPLVIAADGAITYDLEEETEANVTFVLSDANENTQNVTLAVDVPQGAILRQELFDEVRGMIEAYVLGTSNPSYDNVTKSISNCGTGRSVSGKTEYMMVQYSTTSSDEAHLTKNGAVTRPAFGEDDAQLTMTIKLAWYGSFESYFPMMTGYQLVGKSPSTVNIPVAVTVKAYTEAEVAADKAAVDEALANFDVSSIKYFVDGTVADLAAVTGDLSLPSVSGFTAKWTSADDTVIQSPAYSTGRAVAGRDAIGGQDKTTTITLLLTKGGYTNTRSFDVTVKPLTQAELDADAAFLDQVAAALTFDLIKKDNVAANKVISDMQYYYRALPDGNGGITWKTSNSSNNGAQISWTSSNTSVVSQYLKVTRPAGTGTANVTLTFTIKSVVYPDVVADRTVTIPIRVLGADSPISLENNAPMLAEGVAAAVEASGKPDEAFELDLTTIFTDADEDELTYTVKVGDAEPTATAAAYSFTPEADGTYALVFQAADPAGATSPTYTVTLTVSDSLVPADYVIFDGSPISNFPAGHATITLKGGAVVSKSPDNLTSTSYTVYLDERTPLDQQLEIAVVATPAQGPMWLRVNTGAGTFSLSNGKATRNVQILLVRNGQQPVAGGTIAINFVVPQKFAVTVPTSEMFTVTPVNGSASPVLQGSDYCFTVDIAQGYKADRKFAVKANGEALTADEQGVYTIANVNADQEVTVEGVVDENYVEQYTVTLPTSEMFTVAPTEGSVSPVVYPADYSFTVDIEEGYKVYRDFAVKANGTALTPDDQGVYTLHSIEEDTEITVEGVVAADFFLYFDVTATAGEHIAITPTEGSASPVKDGGSYSFTVAFDEGYIGGKSFAVKANDTALTPDDQGIYTIADVSEDIAITATGAIIPSRVTAPAGSTIQLVRVTALNSIQWRDPLKVETLADGTVVNYYEYNDTRGYASMARVTNPDYPTFWYQYDASGIPAGNTLAITATMMIAGDESFTSDKVIKNFSQNATDVGMTYLNLNEAGYINLATGATKTVSACRLPTTISKSTEYLTLADYHYTVIDETGAASDVVTITPDVRNSGLATITANRAGTAIVIASYDAMTYNNGSGSVRKYSASWPEFAGVFVVSVDNDGTSIKKNMYLNKGKNKTSGYYYDKAAKDNIDAEFDILFYVGDEGATYSFKPAAGTTVTVARPTLSASTCTYSGFTGDGVAVADDGTVTVSGLVTGRNIIKVAQGDTANYQVVNARQVSYTLMVDGEDIGAAGKVAQGDEVTVQFSGIVTPVGKAIDSLYGVSSYLQYTAGTSTVTSPTAGLELASTPAKQQVKATIPEDFAGTSYELTGGVMRLSGQASNTGVGLHRQFGYDKSFNWLSVGSGQCNAWLSALPEISIAIDQAPVLAEGVEATASAIIVSGETYGLDLTPLFTDPEEDALTYKVSIDGAAPIAADAAFTYKVEDLVNHEFVFFANDGQRDSTDTYTVMLKVQKPIGMVRVSGLKAVTIAPGGAAEQTELTLRDGNYVLQLNEDYTLSYTGNDAAGVATVTITGVGAYGASRDLKFKVRVEEPVAPAAKSIADVAVSGIETVTIAQAGDAATLSNLKLTDGEKTLVVDEDYEVAYRNNTAAGTATCTITGKGAYEGTRDVLFTVKVAPAVEPGQGSIPISKATVKGLKVKYLSSGDTTQQLTLTYNGRTLEEGVDYTLSYDLPKEGDEVVPGTASVTIHGTGDFTGERVLKYKVKA